MSWSLYDREHQRITERNQALNYAYRPEHIADKSPFGEGVFFGETEYIGRRPTILQPAARFPEYEPIHRRFNPDHIDPLKNERLGLVIKCARCLGFAPAVFIDNPEGAYCFFCSEFAPEALVAHVRLDFPKASVGGDPWFTKARHAANFSMDIEMLRHWAKDPEQAALAEARYFDISRRVQLLCQAGAVVKTHAQYIDVFLEETRMEALELFGEKEGRAPVQGDPDDDAKLIEYAEWDESYQRWISGMFWGTMLYWPDECCGNGDGSKWFCHHMTELTDYEWAKYGPYIIDMAPVSQGWQTMLPEFPAFDPKASVVVFTRPSATSWLPVFPVREVQSA